MRKEGISLITLVITIIVIIILASIVILTLNQNHLLDNASKASFQSSIQDYISQMQLSYITEKADATKEGKIPVIYASTSQEVKQYIPNVRKEDEDSIKIVNGELVYVTQDKNKITWAQELHIIAGEDALYLLELMQVQEKVTAYLEKENTERLGDSLKDHPIEIRGLMYGEHWYQLSDLDIETLGIPHHYFAPYIYHETTGAVLNVTGRVIHGNPVHSLNYFPKDEMVRNNILTGVDENSYKDTTRWGEILLQPSLAENISNQYTEDGGLILNQNSNIGLLPVDQTRPINEVYSVNVTVKGSTLQKSQEGFPLTIVAVSDENGRYVLWIGIHNGYLQVYSFRGNPRSHINNEFQEKGFISVDVKEYDNKIMNIQVTGKRGEKTQLYINGNLMKEFESGNEQYTYRNLTIGDLRLGRGLKYTGIIYQFSLYSDILTKDEITTNWNYAKRKI